MPRKIHLQRPLLPYMSMFTPSFELAAVPRCSLPLTTQCIYRYDEPLPDQNYTLDPWRHLQTPKQLPFDRT